TVAPRFKAEDFMRRKDNLVTGGTFYRWFGLERSEAGNLRVTFNNGDYKHEVDGAKLEPGKWLVVACAVDIPKRKVLAYLNGRKVDDFELPAEFRLRVVGSKNASADKVWAFTNYSNGNVFHGLVDSLL